MAYNVGKWEGPETLVVGLDIGTTFSGATVCHLTPGAEPEIRPVMWPNRDFKFPSVVLYRQTNPIAFGAAAQAAARQAANRGTSLAKWWKLHLHSEAMHGQAAQQMQIPDLPVGVSVEQVYTDFIRYMFREIEDWYREQIDGPEIWNAQKDKMVLVVGHPNGWKSGPLTKLRNAFVQADILSLEAAGDSRRLLFVTEAEASVHFVLRFAGSRSNWLQPNCSFGIVDAGGSTTDGVVYTVKAVEPMLQIDERSRSNSIAAGGVFVSSAMENILRERLDESRFSQRLPAIMQKFENDVKPEFNISNRPYIIEMGDDSDQDKKCGIEFGQMTLSNNEVQRAFAPSVNDILQMVRDLVLGLPNPRPQKLLLVGGFGESRYVKSMLQQHVEGGRQMTVETAQNNSRKAVAEGTTLFYINRFNKKSSAAPTVGARGARFDLGTDCKKRYPQCIPSGPLPPFSIGRTPTVPDSTNVCHIKGFWDRIVTRGTVIGINQCEKRSYTLDLETGGDPHYSVEIWAYEEAEDSTQVTAGWARNQQGEWYPGFTKIGTIKVNLANADGEVVRKATKPGIFKKSTKVQSEIRRIPFQIGIFAGDISLGAKVYYREKGVPKESPALVLPPGY